MKTIRFLILWIAAATIAAAQTDIKDKDPIAGSAVDAAADSIPIVDGSVTSGAAVKLLSIDELVDVPSLFGSVSKTELGYLDGLVEPLSTSLSGKQASLVSGTNIKTVNGSSLLGSGDLSVAGGSWGSISGTLSSQTDLQTALDGKNPLLSHVQGLRNTLANSDNNASAVSMVILGDSFGSFLPPLSLSKLAGSWRCGAATAGGDSGVTEIVDDYAKSPDGRYQQVASGGNLTCGHLTTGSAGFATHVYYTFFTGTGTAQLQYSDNGGTWTSVGSAINTSGITSVQVGSIALPVQSKNIRCRVTATGGTVNGWIGQGASGPGVTYISFCTRGQGLEQTAEINQTIWQNMIAGWKSSGGSQIIVSAFADYRFTTYTGYTIPKGSQGWAVSGAMDTLRTRSKTANSAVDWLVIGPHRVDPARNDDADATIDPLFTALGIGQTTDARIKDGAQAQRDWAIRNGEAFVDCYNMVGSYAEANADGMYSDDIHMATAKGIAYKTAHVMRASNLEAVIVGAVKIPALNFGGVQLSAVADRTSLGGNSVGAWDTSTNAAGVAAPFVGKSFRSPVPNLPETEGMQFYCESLNVARIASYNAGGLSPKIEFYDTTLRPITDQVGSIGTAEKRFKSGCFGGIHTGYVAKTANYTIASLADHTIHCTSGTFDVTLPLAYSAVADNYANAGREIVIVNSGAGTITVKTQSDGSNLQKIDAATTYTLTAGQKVRLQSTGTLTSGDYANWITL